MCVCVRHLSASPLSSFMRGSELQNPCISLSTDSYTGRCLRCLSFLSLLPTYKHTHTRTHKHKHKQGHNPICDEKSHQEPYRHLRWIAAPHAHHTLACCER